MSGAPDPSDRRTGEDVRAAGDNPMIAATTGSCIGTSRSGGEIRSGFLEIPFFHSYLSVPSERVEGQLKQRCGSHRGAPAEAIVEQAFD